MAESFLPARVQLRRVKGFRLQEVAPGAVVVRRPTRWGNPFTVADAIADDPTLTEVEARRRCVEYFELWLAGEIDLSDPVFALQRLWILEHIGDLAGHPLACTCPLPGPGGPDWCHGAILIARANPAEPIPPLTTAWASVYAPCDVAFRGRETVQLAPEGARLL